MSLKSKNLILGASLTLSLAAFGCESSYDEDKLASTESDAATDSKSQDTSDNKSETQESETKSDASKEDKADAGAPDENQSEPKADASKDEPTAKDENKSEAPLYALATIASSGDDSVSYVSLVDKLEGQTLDFADAREFSGQADLWVLGDDIFIADDESMEITKYRRKDKQLEEVGAVNFSNTGVPGVGFWSSVFVSPEKAYVFNKTEAIIWNPSKLEITGTITLPELETRGTLTGFVSYTDRAAVLRGNKLFVPVYWTNEEDFFSYDAKSRIMVIDTEKDELIESLEAPCPGLDFATEDDDGNIYFSSWVFAPPAAAVLDQPTTCIAKIASGNDSVVENAFNVKDVTGGLEGGALRYVGGGKAILSVLDPAHETDGDDIETIAWGDNWRFWTLDLATREASVIEAIGWNAGAAYTSQVGDETFMLVPDGTYSSTTVYRVTGSIDPKPVIEAKGWTMRLFELR